MAFRQAMADVVAASRIDLRALNGLKGLPGGEIDNQVEQGRRLMPA